MLLNRKKNVPPQNKLAYPCCKWLTAPKRNASINLLPQDCSQPSGGIYSTQCNEQLTSIFFTPILVKSVQKSQYCSHWQTGRTEQTTDVLNIHWFIIRVCNWFPTGELTALTLCFKHSGFPKYHQLKVIYVVILSFSPQKNATLTYLENGCNFTKH